jgi:hypothetical protein
MKFDFFLKIDGDCTDEFTFNEMLKLGYTIEVRTKANAAKYSLNDVANGMSLLSCIEA